MNRFSRPGADVAALFPTISGADAEAWARHAHRVGGGTRILLGLPRLVPSGWSRVWSGPW